MKILPDLRGVTIGKFAKKNIAEFSRVETDNYRSLRKPWLRNTSTATRLLHPIRTC